MRLLDIVRHSWRDVVHRRAVDGELDDELAAYVELRRDERVREGETPEAALRAALLEVGGAAQVKEAVRDTRHTALVETIARDARFALRTLRRTPAFTVVAVLTLALGLGGATAIFSVVDTVLLRPLPGVRDPGTLVSLDRLEAGAPAGGFGYPDYADFRAGAPSLDLAASVGAPLGTAIGARGPERLRGALVTGNYFAVLGVRAVAGRLLSAADDSARAAMVVISHSLWQRAYGGEASAVGATIQLDGYPFTIVGVAARDFGGADLGGQVDAWAPLSLQPVLLSRMSTGVMGNRSAGWLEVFGRLAPGATLAGAQAELAVVAARLAADHPRTNGARSVRLRSGIGLDEAERGDLRRLLGLMAAAALLLLLMACANVAGLLLVRAQAREREMAVRVALGAGGRRIAGQLLVEGALLAGAASLVGVAIAQGLSRLALAAQPSVSLLRRVTVGLGPRVLAAMVAATVVVAALIVLAPALGLSRLNPMNVLRDGRSGAGRTRVRVRRVLVAAQVAASLALLSGSAMVALAVRNLLSRNPGFDRASLVLLNLDLTAQGYGVDRGRSFYRSLIDRLATAPSLTSVSFAKTVPPLDWSDGIQIFREGQEPPVEEIRAHPDLGVHAYGDPVAPAFFKTLGVRLLAGREFTTQDDTAAPGVAVVNQALAQLFWPNQSPIGRRIAWPALYGEAPPHRVVEVVGVVADHQYTSLTVAPSPTLFYPVLQQYDGRATLVARTRGTTREAQSALRSAVHDLDPSLPISGEQTMTERMQASLWPQRLLAAWLGVVGVLALVLSFVGLYGVVAQIVGQRARELSVRLALGASPGRVVRGIVREGIVLMLFGVGAGVPLAYLAVTRVRTQLEGIPASPGFAALLAVGVIAAALLLATLLPARRAVDRNPVDALRAD